MPMTSFDSDLDRRIDKRDRKEEASPGEGGEVSVVAAVDSADGMRGTSNFFPLSGDLRKLPESAFGVGIGLVISASAGLLKAESGVADSNPCLRCVGEDRCAKT